MAQMTYTDPAPIEQPTLGLRWTQGTTQEVPEEHAALWDADERSPFSGARKKAARDARAAVDEMVAAVQAETAPKVAPDVAQEVPSL